MGYLSLKSSFYLIDFNYYFQLFQLHFKACEFIFSLMYIFVISDRNPITEGVVQTQPNIGNFVLYFML